MTCRTEAELVRLARDFIAQFSPYEIASMPEPCRPPHVRDAKDITDYAFELVRHHCDHGEAHDYAIHRLTVFFSTASVRLSQVLQSA